MAIRDENDSPSVESAEPRNPASEPKPGPGIAPWLLAAGGSLCLVAGAILLSPWASPAQASISRSLARHGVLPGALAACGVTLLGLYLLARENRRASIALQLGTHAPEERLSGLAESLDEARSGIRELQLELVYVKEALRAAQEPREDGDGETQPHDGMFRMAASLDQLGARLEQRLKAQHLDVQESLLEIHGHLDSLRERMAGMRDRGEGREEPDDARDHGPRIELVTEPAATDARLDRAEEIRWDPIEEEAPTNLGLLDSLDDLGQPLPSRTSAAIRPQAAGPRGIGIPGPAEEPGAPLPAAQDETSEDLPIECKLEQLTSLLADPRVREALEAVRRAEMRAGVESPGA